MNLRLIPMLLLSIFLGACGGEKMEGINLEPAVTRLVHEPESLMFGESWDARRITLEVGFDDGSVEDVTHSAVWSSDDETVASVSAGDVTPMAAGETVVRAVYKGHKVEVPVTVQVLFTGLGASPASVAFGGAGGQTTLQLFARYSDGSEQDVSDEADWTSADPAVATVAGSATVTPVGHGETSITARYGEYEMEIPVSVEVVFSSGEGTAVEPYAITTAEQLNGLRFYSGEESEGSYFELMGNIDMSDPAFIDDSSGWVPIGASSSDAFAGIFSGNGFTISNLYIDRPEQTNQGLFGHLNGATVTDLHLESVDITGKSRVGALAGEIQNTSLQGVTASGTVETQSTSTSGSSVGGLIGYAGGSDIVESGASVTVTAADHNIGGLVGYALTTDIRASYSQGDVIGNGMDAINIGALVGYLGTASVVENSYATGSISAVGARNGGLVGLMSSDAAPAPVIKNSYAAGTVNAPDNGSSGGLVGALVHGSISDSFYIDDRFGEGPDKGEPVGEAELGDASTFPDYDPVTGTGWDFDTIWTMSTEDGRPALRWEAL